MGLPIIVPWRARRSPYAPFSMIRVLAEESNTEIQSLHVATLDERALGYIDELMQPWHQAVHENLREELPEHVYERYGLVISYGSRAQSFQQQHHDCLIDCVKLPDVEAHDIKFDNRPCHLQEVCREPVRFRRLIPRQGTNDPKDLLLSEPH
jgi:hypothetical protein